MNLVLDVPAEAVENSLARYPGKTGDGPDAIAAAHRYHVLPLYNDFMGCFALRPSGECVFVAWDAPEQAVPVQLGLPDFRVIHVARVRGALRYPDIPGIMPERPADARVCPSCHGTGQAIRPEFVCECGGLGWVPWASEGAA
jgi:hypothetical protein